MMNKKNLTILFTASAVLGFATVGCKKEKTPTSNNTGNTTITYEGNVKALLSSKGCTGCHGGTKPKMDSYATAKSSISKIIGAINHSAGFEPMPKGGAKLSADEIKVFTDWNSQGLLEK